MTMAFPYRIDSTGRTAVAQGDEHVRELLEQLLFTNPGERVNRPGFGCGLLQLVFEGNSPQLATGLTATITAAVTQWLADLVELRSVDVVATDGTLEINVGYAVRASAHLGVATFSVPVRP